MTTMKRNAKVWIDLDGGHLRFLYMELSRASSKKWPTNEPHYPLMTRPFDVAWS